MHPFVSAAATLRIFKHLGFVEEGCDDAIGKVCELIKESVQPVQNVDKRVDPNDKYTCQEVHSHHHLQEIFTIFWRDIAKRGSFVDINFRIVMFHQTVDTVSKWGGNMVSFSDDFEYFKFCDPLLLKYMYVMQSSDSSSYVFWNNQKQADANDILFQDASIAQI